MNVSIPKKLVARVAGVSCFLALGALVIPVGAEDETTPVEDEQSCGEAIKACNTKPVSEAYGEMRAACNEFRHCKQSCGLEKSQCGTAAKLAKQDCNESCKGKSGKDKKECKRACNDAKRDAKRACRDAKKSCNQTCRNDFQQTDCVKARAKFWGELTETAKNCAADIGDKCQDAFPKK